MKSSNVVRLFAAFLAGHYFLTQCVFASFSEMGVWGERHQTVKLNIFHPFTDITSKSTLQSFGTIRKILMPVGKTKIGTVIHIQDIHHNFEAQLNISRAVQKLIQTRNINLVALEGSSAKIDLSSFNKVSDQDSVHRVADFLIHENKISGPIHALLKQPEKNLIQGIDDSTYYQLNVEAYQKAEKVKPIASDHLRQRIRVLENKKKIIFPSKLREFDQILQTYHKGFLAMGKYIGFISLYRNRGEGDVFKNLKDFLVAYNIEKNINLNEVERERIMLLETLLIRLSAEEKKGLLNISNQFKFGIVDHAQFYHYLKNLCGHAHLSTYLYPNLNKYIEYLFLVEKIDDEQLSQEISQREKEIYGNLSQTEEQRQLIQETQYNLIIEKLLNFSLNRAEWEQNKNKFKDDPYLNPFCHFYENAEIRDEKMARNFLKVVSGSQFLVPNEGNAQGTENKESGTYVLVTGGFHSSGIDEKLVNAGYEVLQFVPKVSRINSEGSSTYLSVFSQRKTPLERLFEREKLFLAEKPWTDYLKFQAALLVVMTVIRKTWMLTGHVFQENLKTELEKLTGKTSLEPVVTHVDSTHVTVHLSGVAYTSYFNLNGEINKTNEKETIWAPFVEFWDILKIIIHRNSYDFLKDHPHSNNTAVSWVRIVSIRVITLFLVSGILTPIMIGALAGFIDGFSWRHLLIVPISLFSGAISLILIHYFQIFIFPNAKLTKRDISEEVQLSGRLGVLSLAKKMNVSVENLNSGHFSLVSGTFEENLAIRLYENQRKEVNSFLQDLGFIFFPNRLQDLVESLLVSDFVNSLKNESDDWLETRKKLIALFQSDDEKKTQKKRRRPNNESTLRAPEIVETHLRALIQIGDTAYGMPDAFKTMLRILKISAPNLLAQLIRNFDEDSLLLSLLGIKPERNQFVMSADGQLRAISHLGSNGVPPKITVHEKLSATTSDLTGHLELAHHLTFSPDGRFLAATDDQFKVYVWSISKKKIIFQLKGARSVRAFQFSSDGNYLAILIDGKVILCDVFLSKMSAQKDLKERVDSIQLVNGTTIVFFDERQKTLGSLLVPIQQETSALQKVLKMGEPSSAANKIPPVLAMAIKENRSPTESELQGIGKDFPQGWNIALTECSPSGHVTSLPPGMASFRLKKNQSEKFIVYTFQFDGVSYVDLWSIQGKPQLIVRRRFNSQLEKYIEPQEITEHEAFVSISIDEKEKLSKDDFEKFQKDEKRFYTRGELLELTKFNLIQGGKQVLDRLIENLVLIEDAGGKISRDDAWLLLNAVYVLNLEQYSLTDLACRLNRYWVREPQDAAKVGEFTSRLFSHVKSFADVGPQNMISRLDAIYFLTEGRLLESMGGYKEILSLNDLYDQNDLPLSLRGVEFFSNLFPPILESGERLFFIVKGNKKKSQRILISKSAYQEWKENFQKKLTQEQEKFGPLKRVDDVLKEIGWYPSKYKVFVFDTLPVFSGLGQLVVYVAPWFYMVDSKFQEIKELLMNKSKAKIFLDSRRKSRMKINRQNRITIHPQYLPFLSDEARRLVPYLEADIQNKIYQLIDRFLAGANNTPAIVPAEMMTLIDEIIFPKGKKPVTSKKNKPSLLKEKKEIPAIPPITNIPEDKKEDNPTVLTPEIPAPIPLSLSVLIDHMVELIRVRPDILPDELIHLAQVINRLSGRFISPEEQLAAIEMLCQGSARHPGFVNAFQALGLTHRLEMTGAHQNDLQTAFIETEYFLNNFLAKKANIVYPDEIDKKYKKRLSDKALQLSKQKEWLGPLGYIVIILADVVLPFEDPQSHVVADFCDRLIDMAETPGKFSILINSLGIWLAMRADKLDENNLPLLADLLKKISPYFPKDYEASLRSLFYKELELYQAHPDLSPLAFLTQFEKGLRVRFPVVHGLKEEEFGNILIEAGRSFDKDLSPAVSRIEKDLESQPLVLGLNSVIGGNVETALRLGNINRDEVKVIEISDVSHLDKQFALSMLWLASNLKGQVVLVISPINPHSHIIKDEVKKRLEKIKDPLITKRLFEVDMTGKNHLSLEEVLTHAVSQLNLSLTPASVITWGRTSHRWAPVSLNGLQIGGLHISIHQIFGFLLNLLNETAQYISVESEAHKALLPEKAA